MQRKLTDALLPWLVLGVLVALWIAIDSALLAALRNLIGGLPDWQISYWSIVGFVLSLLGAWLVQRALRRRRRERRQRRADNDRQLFEQAADAQLLFDARGRLLDVNQRALSAFGDERAALLQRPLGKLCAGSGAQPARELLARLDECLNGAEPRFDWAVPQRDGVQRWYEARLRCLSRDGQPVVLASLRDSGRQRLQRDALERSEQRWRTLVEQMPSLPLVGVDQDDRISAWNSAAEQRYGHSSAEAIGRPLAELLAPDGAASRLTQDLQRWREQGQGPAEEYCWKHRHGGLLHVALHRLRVEDEAGGELFLVDRAAQEEGGGDAGLALLHAAAQVTLELLRVRDPESAVSRALGLLGRALDCDSLALWQLAGNADGSGENALRLSRWQRQARLGLPVDEPRSYDVHAHLRTWYPRLAEGVTLRLPLGEGTSAGDALLDRFSHSALVVPIQLEGRCWGFLLAGSLDDARRWGAGEERALHIAGAALASALQRRRQDEALRHHAKVFEATHDGVLITDLSGNIVAVNDAFCRISGYGASDVLGRTPALLRSPRHDDEFFRAMWEALARQGHWRGEIWNRRRDGELIPQWLDIGVVRDEYGEATHYVAVGTDISELKRSEQQLHYLAHHDALTGLPNRMLAELRLEHAIDCADRNARKLAVLFVDLDGFKRINDSLGHPVGDRLLRQVAERLHHRVRGNDTLARLGGDEFLILAEDLHSAADAAQVADKLLHALEQPFVIEDREVFLGASVGIALYPGHGNTGEELIRAADTAMYRAKQSGRNQVSFYTREMNREALDLLQLDSNLRGALQAGEFELHFQPKQRAGSREISGFEALLRMRAPDGSLVSPDRFIGLAERTGIIVSIGAWVLREACQQAQRWRLQGYPLNIAVNVSARQFRVPGFIDDVAGVLARSGLPPEALELELTESLLVEDPEAMVERLRALKAIGVRIALDDFGTGYSSLGYLARFPIDALKIDRSFVANLSRDQHSVQLISAIIDLGRRLGMKLVAEGVETEDQLAFLERQHCDELQGFLISRPLPAEQAEAFLAGSALPTRSVSQPSAEPAVSPQQG